MILEKPFRGVNYQLRSVNPNDSEDILRLRLDDSRNAFIHQTTPSFHETWLIGQMKRPDDYYFAIEELNDCKTHGFVGIYDIQMGKGEWGRWILNPTSSAALESYWLILRFGFSIGLNQIYSRTDLRNQKVISIHDSFQFSKVEVVSEESSDVRYKVHTLDLLDWPIFEDGLRKYLRLRAK